MIFITLNQLNCFLIFIFLGCIFGFIFNLFNILFLKKYQKNFLKIIFDGIFYTFFAIFYVIFLNLFNFGQFNIVLILAIILGFIWVNKMLKNLVAKIELKWYNVVTKFKRKPHAKGKIKQS